MSAAVKSNVYKDHTQVTSEDLKLSYPFCSFFPKVYAFSIMLFVLT